jgi:hypothetical protein
MKSLPEIVMGLSEKHREEVAELAMWVIIDALNSLKKENN